jgi:hypothetical protein
MKADKEVTDSSNQMSERTSEIIYDEVVKRYERELERTANLDNKANNIIGFVGILAGIISGFGAFTLKVPETYAETVVTIFFVLSLLFIFVSIIAGLKSYFPKKFTIVPDPYFLIGKYEKADQEQTVRDLSDNYAVAVDDNMAINDGKSTNIKRAVWSLFVAIVFFSLFTLGLAFSVK